MSGMNAEAIREIGVALKREGSRLGDIRGAIDHTASGLETVWRGREAVTFNQDWHGLRAQLESVSAELIGLGQSALNNASEQERVSASMRALASEVTIPEDEQLLGLAANAYGHTSLALPDGWAAVTDDELRRLGLDPDRFHTSSGLDATLFKNGEGDYVLAFRGTDFDSQVDWQNNVEAIKGVSTQQREAVALALSIKSAADANMADLQFTGHSLGGNLAAVSSIATGLPAVTFNAAGVSTSALVMASRQGGDPSLMDQVGIFGENVLSSNVYLGYALQAQRDSMMTETFGSQITAYHESFDPVTLAQEYLALPVVGNPPAAIGLDISVSDPTPNNPHPLESIKEANSFRK